MTRAAALLMSAQGALGALVAVADRDGDAARETARLVEAAGGRALPLTVDVMDEDSVAGMVGATVGGHAPARRLTPVRPARSWGGRPGGMRPASAGACRAVTPGRA
ncbi:hypothetical protein ACWEU6_31435 [Streptosporangium sandarakinum]|uniref:hypothetical protein n=1 Tax=Streptosporangium sandarakinum TaxID=1260955 RepID=UPI003697EDD9